MTIYIDIVLIENIFMNYIILFATATINKTDIKLIRIFLASLLGGIYAIVAYISDLEFYKTLTLKLLLSIAMVYIALKPSTMKKCLKQLLIFYLTSFTFGGTAFALLYFIKPSEIFIQNGIYIGSYPLKIAILGGIVGFITIVIAFKIIKGKMTSKNMYCKIEIELNNQKIESNAMIDTGNLLKEPISGKPVIIVENDLLKMALPEEILNNTQNIIQGNTQEIPIEYLSKLRVIPFTSLGMPNGMLLGMKAEKVTIYSEDEKILVENVIIGLYDKKLSKSGKYTSLIGISLIEGRKAENEHIGYVKV